MTAYTFWLENAAGHGFEATYRAQTLEEARQLAWVAVAEHPVAHIECVAIAEAQAA